MKLLVPAKVGAFNAYSMQFEHMYFCFYLVMHIMYYNFFADFVNLLYKYLNH